MLSHNYVVCMAGQIARAWQRTCRRRRVDAAPAVPPERDLDRGRRHALGRRLGEHRPALLGLGLLARGPPQPGDDRVDARLARDPRRQRRRPPRSGRPPAATVRGRADAARHRPHLARAVRVPHVQWRLRADRGVAHRGVAAGRGEPSGRGGQGERHRARGAAPRRRRPRGRGRARSARSAAGRGFPTRCSRATGTARPTPSPSSGTCGSTPATSRASTTTASSTSSTARRTRCAGGREHLELRDGEDVPRPRRDPRRRGARGAERDGRGRGEGHLCAATRRRAHAEELCRWAAERVPYFAIPRYIEFRDDLPRNPVGRVLKYELRDRA